ncbi:MAG TPA: SAM-dependent methyltransferase [Candidatus Competibacteraceae bacterium]|nr:SAM-dependent methyltransferase [Candidatus Competibacteraceae bacterium]HRZ05863.1 SAM-dependent methyltransferase [Candidatus Competibacteraceae bacterium]HSA45632.1 SAM-dependent methyltransferase [Candidatus Competibacteraceae bacterium]
MVPSVDLLKTLPAPDPAAAAHSAQVLDHIRTEIAATGGAISFARFMHLALYAPGLGYYCAGTRKFGSGGDFITAPELSPLFSRCLARQCQDILQALGGGAIVELGAGTGIMAADLLQELQTLNALPEQYAILELSGELRERQRQTLVERIPELVERVVWLDALPQPGFRGLVLGNEVLDALPVERFRITAQGVRRLVVVATETGLTCIEGEDDPSVTEAVARIEADIGWRLPEGYTSEYVPHLAEWLAALAEPLAAGALLLIDYGYPRREYYHPERATGTLLCHYRHRAHEDPLLLPGLQDITASVDFTAVADAALAAGLEVAGYARQSHFLFGCGLMELLAEDEGISNPAHSTPYLEQARQVKLLTLPGEMGDRFQAIALTRNLEIPLRGFAFRDERSRL